MLPFIRALPANSFLFLFIVTSSLVFPALSAQASEILTVGAGSGEYNVVPHLQLLIDPDRDWTIEDVSSAPLDRDFVSNTKNWLSLGFTRAAVWIRFSVANKGAESSEKWILVLDVPSIEHADLYVPGKEGTFDLLPGGKAVPLSGKVLIARTHAYPLILEPGTIKTCYMRLSSETALVVDLHLSTPETYLAREQRDLYLFLLFAGAFLTIAISNLMVFVSTRDRNYLYLGCFIASLGFFMASNFGLASLFLWPESPGIGKLASPFFGALCVLWGLVFTRRFVDSKKNMPRLDHLFRGMIFVAFGLTVLTFLHSYAANVLVGILAFFAFSLALYSSVLRMRDRYEAARPFFFVMIFSMLGGLLFLLMAFGFLGMSLLTFGMGPLAFLGGILLLIMALGTRLSTLQSNYLQVFNSVNDAIFIYSPDTDEVLDVNQRACELFGDTREGLLNRGIRVLIGSAQASEPKGEAWRWVREPGPKEPFLHVEQMQKREGGIFWGEVNLIQATLGRRKCVLGVMRDVTERKRMQDELLQGEKLESLRILAGGIAHDFNNILTAILSNISMARIYGNLEDDIAGMLDDAEKASIRAKNLTNRLLTFTRGGAPVRKTIALESLIKETAEFALSGSQARCEFSIPDDLWAVEADEGQIAQVIQNLVINADQAMLSGGTMKICAENVQAEKEEASSIQMRELRRF